jgi:hypothetical protein
VPLIAAWRRRLSPSAPVTVWIPDFFSNAWLEPLRAAGVTLVFYPLLENSTPDMAACRELLKREPADIFLLVHYFGKPTATGAAAEFCARNGTWLVEDAAQVLLPTQGIGVSGDFVLYSPHKHLALPEGALLVVRGGGPGRFIGRELESFGSPESWANQLGDLRRQLGCPKTLWNPNLRWLAGCVKRKLRYAARDRRMPNGLSAATEEAHSSKLPPPQHGQLARRLLTGMVPDLGTFARYRERHQLLWDALILPPEDAGSAVVSTTDRPLRREWIPYLAGYRVNPMHAEPSYRSWREKGLPVCRWPEIPLEVNADPGGHGLVWGLSRGSLYLPVHQAFCQVGIRVEK